MNKNFYHRGVLSSFLPLDLFSEIEEAELSNLSDQRQILMKWICLPWHDAASNSQSADQSILWWEHTNCMATTLSSRIHLTTSDHETKNQKVKWKVKHIIQGFNSPCISSPMPLVKHNLDALCSLHFSNNTVFLTGLQSPGMALLGVEYTGSLQITEGSGGVRFKEDRCKKAHELLQLFPRQFDKFNI